MKIAILHDYFDEIGGAEIMLLFLARKLNATIYTTNITWQNVNKLGYSDVKIISIGNVPQLRNLKQFFTQMRFSLLKINGYDFYIVGGSYSIHCAKNHKPNLWICFSPLRGLFDLIGTTKGIFYPIKSIIKQLQRAFDKRAVKEIQLITAPSVNVQERILKFYNRECEVIYRPVSTNCFKYRQSEGYWLSVGRIDPYKRIELQINAFSKLLDKKLIIVGAPSDEFRKYYHFLKTKATNNIIFMDAIFNRYELANLYSNCEGVLVTAINEDFGVVPIEAMASGKPVVAPNEGGYKETIINNLTGKLIDNINAEKIIMAIKTTSKRTKGYKKACLNQSKKFDEEIFIKKIRNLINTIK